MMGFEPTSFNLSSLNALPLLSIPTVQVHWKNTGPYYRFLTKDQFLIYW